MGGGLGAGVGPVCLGYGLLLTNNLFHNAPNVNAGYP